MQVGIDFPNIFHKDRYAQRHAEGAPLVAQRVNSGRHTSVHTAVHTSGHTSSHTAGHTAGELNRDSYQVKKGEGDFHA